MKLERIQIADLRPLEKNVRKHNEKQIDELIRSLNQFGQTRAIVIDEENNVLIGNGLYYALKKRGDTECDCERKVGLTETQKKKLVLTDNKVFSLGVDDYDAITEFINEIADNGDFDIAGFDEDVIKQMTRELSEVETDIMNYGVIQTPAENAVSEAQPEKVSDNLEENRTSESAAEPPQTTPDTEDVPVAPPTAANTEPKTIICPSCGEVIYLD
ncbi:MAG: ParB/Srx family N-terminal domain-containing protein [Bacteroidaceae bacterium]|nr:ParB/Srx family N-terminal domain-containing protein [Bacteroidaceae bacterium]